METILIGQATIKLIIDFVITPSIQEQNRKYIPYVAVALGLARGLAFLGDSLETAISSGIAMGLGAIGVNELTKK